MQGLLFKTGCLVGFGQPVDKQHLKIIILLQTIADYLKVIIFECPIITSIEGTELNIYFNSF